MKNIFEKLQRLFHYLFITLPFEANERNFRAHNRHVWSGFLEKADASGEILVEVYPVASSVVAQSYLANALGKAFHAGIVAFDPHFPTFLRRIYNYRNWRIYRSFGAKSFMYIQLTASERAEVEGIVEKLMPQLKTKKQVEDLCVEGVWIGDLLYDSHLMRKLVPTIDFADPKFRESVMGAISYFVFWRNYLAKHNVKAAIVSHCVYYENAVLVRLCVHRNIPCYQVNATSCFYVDEKHVRAYNDYLYLPEEFARMPEEERRAGLELAEKRLAQRFSGQVGVDMPYSTKSAYGNDTGNRVLRESDKLKILIAPHCFFDSPHPYGNNLFTDFYEWLHFLGEISNRTDYDWYIKTHPDVLPGNEHVIAELVKKYPKFTLLPKTVSHHQIIRDGVNVALTVFGTIAVEYAGLGINVINASKSNPHAAYDFALHLDDEREYEKILLNLRDLKVAINRDKVHEFYFMYYLARPEDWLYRNYKKFVADIGGYNEQAKSVAYDYFMREYSRDRHEAILKMLNEFIASKEYCLFKRHLEKLPV